MSEEWKAVIGVAILIAIYLFILWPARSRS